MTTEGRKNEDERTAGEVFAGDLRSSSLFAVSINAMIISVAYSRPPSAKLSSFWLTLVRVVSVAESSTHTNKSCSRYRVPISSYLHRVSAYSQHPGRFLLTGMRICRRFLQQCCTVLVDRGCDSVQGSSTRGHRTVENVVRLCQMPGDALNPNTRYRPCPQVGKWTSATVGGPYNQRSQQFLSSAICDSPPIQTARTLSHTCRGTSKTPGTCDDMSIKPKRGHQVPLT